MPLPYKRSKSSKPRRRMLILAECFLSDYKASTCRFGPCKDCTVAQLLSDFDLRSAKVVASDDEIHGKEYDVRAESRAGPDRGAAADPE